MIHFETYCEAAEKAANAVQDATVSVTGFKREHLLGASRNAGLVAARTAGWRVQRARFGTSSPMIGKFWGRNFSTVLNGLKKPPTAIDAAIKALLDRSTRHELEAQQ